MGILAALASKLGKAASFQRRCNLQLLEEALGNWSRALWWSSWTRRKRSQPALEEVRLP